MKLGAWRKEIQNRMNNWKLVNDDMQCKYCNEVKVDFRAKFVGVSNTGESTEPKKQDQTVNVLKGEGRSNLNEWYWGDTEVSEAPYSTVVHEVAHAFGIADEYCDPELYPDMLEEYLSDNYQNSITYDSSKGFWARHIESIVNHEFTQAALPCKNYKVRKR